MLPTDLFQNVSAVVAIPVRDEAERIGDCLLSLARQHGGSPGVVLLVNNTTDTTMERVGELRPTLNIPIVVIEHVFPTDLANAGQARRLAMEHAHRLAPPQVPLLCTDADSRAAPDWVENNLVYLEHGIEAVFGRAEIDVVEAARIPPALIRADADECAYAEILDHLAHLIDPDPNDPWPRHTEHSGASIALTRSIFDRVGGIPPVALGEDRALADALRRVDARIRHAPDVRVIVSGRILGRAPGGMADTIRRRLVAPDVMLDDALEAASAHVARLRVRRAARTGFAAARAGCPETFVALACSVGVGRQTAKLLATRPAFGTAWAVLDAGIPRRPVPVAELPEHMSEATRLLADHLADAALPAYAE